MFVVNRDISFQEEHECLIVGLYEKPVKFEGYLEKLDQFFDGYLTELVKNGDLSAKNKSMYKMPSFKRIGSKRLYFVGLGKEKEASFDKVREAFGRAFKEVKKAGLEDIAVYADSFTSENIDAVEVAYALSEALLLSTYEFTGYKHKTNGPVKQLEGAIVYCQSAEPEEIQAALSVGCALGEGTNSARTLVNLPGNMLTATMLANYAEDLAERYDFEVEVLEKEELLKLGMGALLAVNQGSTQPPKMIVLKYQGKEEWKDVIGLVGKGITFDTGGYSIKTKDGIVGMKTDMGGAAAVLGAMEIIGELRPEQNVVAVIPSTDNMISGSALKPDDVITSLSGKTIEVLNTDAEGRLVLADAVTYAKMHGANFLVDVATLTGGVITALGVETTGAMTNNEGWFEQVLEASNEAGERVWRLPIFESDRERVRSSKIADLNNSPGREGHAIMGGAFIGEFAEDTPWVHLDIAGTATTSKETPLGPQGATGVMTRTLALLVERFEAIN